MSAAIPFNRPHLTGRELGYIAAAVAEGNAAGDGRFSAACVELLERRLPGTKVLLTTSCTAALELAALLADLRPGDEVILPSFTFVSTANAFVRVGARPVFADVDPDTLTLDPAAVAAAIGPRTRALVPVHYGGGACDMTALSALARTHDLLVIEDAAQGIAASFGGKPLGTLGDLGCLSFHETKNVHCGQGGALLVSRPADVARAEVLRDRGTDRRRFFRGEVERYSWVDVGSGSPLSEILAAFLYAQLESLDALTRQRAAIYGWYLEGLTPLARAGHFRLPRVHPDADTNHHLLYLLLPDPATREALRAFLSARDIHSVIHYVPLHGAPFGRTFGPHAPLPVTDDVSARLLRLPLYPDLSQADVARVVDGVAAFFATASARHQ